MKIRSGFVSNSSSSSYILSYDKSKVLTDPAKIVEFVKNNPDTPLLLRGWDCGEGDDIFFLSEEQKSLIRMFPQEFIKQNSGTVKRDQYVYNEDTEDYEGPFVKEVPTVVAYPEANLTPDKYEYTDPEVDMSDMGPEPERNYTTIINRTPEQQAEIDREEAWYKEHRKRIHEARKAYRREAVEEEKKAFISYGVASENAEAEFIQVSNRSCDEDCGDAWEFPYRYLSPEDPYMDRNYYSVKKFKTGKPRPCAVVYSALYENKKDIAFFIEHMNLDTKCYLLWTDPVINTAEDYETTQYDFFEIGEEEKALIVENKEAFLENKRRCVLFISAAVTSGDDNVYNGKITTLYGKIVIIPRGADIRDFKKCAIQ